MENRLERANYLFKKSKKWLFKISSVLFTVIALIGYGYSFIYPCDFNLLQVVCVHLIGICFFTVVFCAVCFLTVKEAKNTIKIILSFWGGFVVWGGANIMPLDSIGSYITPFILLLFNIYSFFIGIGLTLKYLAKE